jgi:predicted nucleotidyltransferase
VSATDKPIEDIVRALQERAKELNCLYRVDEILSHTSADRDAMTREMLEALPAGWQFPHACQAKLVLDGRVYKTDAYVATPWSMSADVLLEGERIGELTVSYAEKFPPADEGPFLKEERRLLHAIVERIGYAVMQRRLRRAVRTLENAATDVRRHQWDLILDFLRSTDRQLLLRITRRMINHLCVNGVAEAKALLQRIAPTPLRDEGADADNRPRERVESVDVIELTAATFRIAAAALSDDEVFDCIQGWIKEDKTAFLYEAVERLDTSLPEIADAIVRYRALNLPRDEVPLPVRIGLRVALLRRFFSERLDYVTQAKNFVEVEDFYELVERMICPQRSHGKLGGKSAGLFLAAQVIRKLPEYASVLGDIRTPKTWYVTSDALLTFIRFNKMEDVYNRKYLDVGQIRMEYPHLVQVFKNSPFPPEIVQGLAVALDDFDERPIIVRSSSLLEDHAGAAFSGKYKSLFLANQGSKAERLAALQDAIAEVYASVFGPDPIEYRAERGLLDVHEEMGIMIQEVVGTRVGPYWLPVFAGVAVSRNEFRWSARIRREDGLVRIVPGLGTRAVDRLGDDYPVLVAPGQPGLRVSVTAEEVARYSPAKADVINLETNAFETIDVRELLRTHGRTIPLVRQIVSVLDGDRLSQPMGLGLDFERADLRVTFEGLFRDTSFLARMRTLLTVLEERLGTPVDIEFASDGTDFYLLQCRPQCASEMDGPATIPHNVPLERVLFRARRHVSNGRMPDLTHVVYVDPQAYDALSDREQLCAVARAVGRLNATLPKRQFVLLGPGRWGSRGDLKLGVGVTYSDINNTAMLVEIARAKGGYVPDLSFGTHFFQDLVEARIRYLPLYPDDEGAVLHEPFLLGATNLLAELAPEHADLAEVIRVIDVPRETGGKVLRVLLNADLDEGLALLVDPHSGTEATEGRAPTIVEVSTEEHSRWRMRMAERVASQIDATRFGVQALYVFGSVKNGTAGPASDLDLIVHFVGDEHQRADLELWLDGFSTALAEANYMRTGHRRDRLFDLHFVTDDEIARQTPIAAKIGAVTDSARPLALGAPLRADAAKP